MRPFTGFLAVLAAGIVTYTILIPAALVVALVALALQVVAALCFIGMVLSFLGWLFTHDAVALSATAKLAVWGCAAFLPSFVAMHYISAWLFRPPKLALDAPFEQQQLSGE